jgi:zinc protease
MRIAVVIRFFCFAFITTILLPSISFSDYSVASTKLDNGLTLLTLEDHSSTLVAVQIYYHVGSKNESPGITGITRICQKMMLEGTPLVPKGEYTRVIQAGGGTVTSEASMDYTLFAAKGSSAMLDTILFLEADRMQNIELTYEKLLLAKETVRKERLTHIESFIYGPLNEEIFGLSYQIHPYQYPWYGLPTDLQNITLNDLNEYFGQYFQPAAATIVVVGGIKTERVVNKVKEFFGNIISRPIPERRKVIEPEQRGEKREVMETTSDIPVFVVSYHIPATSDTDLPALRIIRRILVSGESSRIFKKSVVDSRSAITVNGDLFELEDPGIIFFYAILNYDSPDALIEAEMITEIDRLKSEYVSPAELEKAKNQIEAAFYKFTAPLDQIGYLVGFYQLCSSGWQMINKEVAAARAVTQEDIMRVARRYFKPSNRTVIKLIPASDQEDNQNSGAQ